MRTALLRLGIVGALAPIRAALGQCPDGTPPPCEVAAAPRPRVTPPPEAERARNLLVLPFRNVTRSSEYEWLVEGSPTLLGDALGNWHDLRVVPDEQMYAAARRRGLSPRDRLDAVQIRGIAEETRGWTAVTGDVIGTPGRVRIRVRAYDVVTNRVLVTSTAEVRGDGDVVAAYEHLAGELLGTVGLDATGLDLAAATTQSIDAYKSYLQGLAHLNRSEYRQARAAFREAVTLDTAFAQAYARLAQASMQSVEGLLNPRDSAYVFAQRAVDLSGGLPARDQQLLRAINAQFQGRFTDARRDLEALAASDSNDIDALEWLAGLELFDPIIVSAGGVPRPRGSSNAAARLAKRVLALDPARHRQYANLASLYLDLAGSGLNPGRTYGFHSETESLASFVTRPPDATWTAMLRDTIVLLDLDSAALLPPDSLRVSRTRARSAAAAWVERWLAAGPSESEAHLAASRISELLEDFDRALAELAAADSLGVQSELEDPRLRRVQLLSRAGRSAEAQQLVDSLWDTQYLARAHTFLTSEGIGWVFGAQLMSGDFSRAQALYDVLSHRVAALFEETVRQLQTRGRLAGGPVRSEVSAQERARTAMTSLAAGLIGERIPRMALDSVLVHIERYPQDFELARRLSRWIGIALVRAEAEEKHELGRRAIAAASVLHARGGTWDSFLAKELVRLAVRADTTLRATADGLSWYREQQASDARVLDAQQRSTPAGARVDASGIAFDWNVDDSRPWIWGDGQSGYAWSVTFEVRGRTLQYSASYWPRQASAGTDAKRGTLAQLSEGLDLSLTERTPLPDRPGSYSLSPVPGVGLDVVRTSAGLRMTIAEPAFAAQFQALGLRSVSFSYTPCIATAERPNPCPSQPVAVTYEMAPADSVTAVLLAAATREATGDTIGALDELRRSAVRDSRVDARRMILLGQLARYDEAARVADSLWNAGHLTAAAHARTADAAVSWGFALALMKGRFDRADSLYVHRIERIARRLAAASADSASAPDAAVEELTASLRTAALDSMLERMTASPRAILLLQRLPQVVMNVARAALPAVRGDSPAMARIGAWTREAANKLIDASLAVADAGQVDVAYSIAQAAQRLDVEVVERLAAARWYLDRWMKSAARLRFRPSRALVQGAEARFEWATLDTLPFTWNRRGVPVGETEHGWIVGLGEIDGQQHTVQVTQFRGSDDARSGSLADLLAAAMPPRVFKVPSGLVPASVRTELTTDGFAIVVADRGLVNALRRAHPTTVSFGFRPCDPDPRDVRGSCSFEPVPVEYIDR